MSGMNPAEPPLPRRFGQRHVLLKPLAEGGMGRIFLAASGGRLCAVKVMRPDRANPELLARFRGEAQLMTRLAHRNVVFATEAGDVEGTPYFAMEYIRGRSLAQVMTRASQMRRRIPIGLALYITNEILLGLGHLHEAVGRGFVHRDISPTNVMLSFDGAVKIIDLGLGASRDHAPEAMNGQWGQENYQAPEHVAGRPLDARSDIFSVGIMLWEMLASRRLFGGIEGRHAEAPRPSQFNKRVPEDLEGIVMTALASEPGDRYSGAGAFLKALRPHLLAHDDAASLSAFLCEVFAEDVARERAEEDRLRLAAEEMPAAPARNENVSATERVPALARSRAQHWRWGMLAGLVIALLFGGVSAWRERGSRIPGTQLATPPPAPREVVPSPQAPEVPQPLPVPPAPAVPPTAVRPAPQPRSVPKPASVVLAPAAAPEADTPQELPSVVETPANSPSAAARKLVLAAERLMGGGDFVAALNAANDSLKEEETVEAHLLVARVHWARGLLLSAERAATRGLSTFPDEPRLLKLRREIAERRSAAQPARP